MAAKDTTSPIVARFTMTACQQPKKAPWRAASLD